MNIDERKLFLMEIALKEAKKAYIKGEIPVGAVLVRENKIISKAHNIIQKSRNTLKHAEMITLEKGMKKLNSKFLSECELYITLEPCPMCAGAIMLAKIKKVYIATKDPKSGFGGSVYNVLDNNKLNHKCEIEYGILENESSQLLKNFFIELRNSKKQKL